MPVLCVGEVHFSSIERMHIRVIFNWAIFFLRETFILAPGEHESLRVSRAGDTAVAGQLMGQFAYDRFQLG